MNEVVSGVFLAGKGELLGGVPVEDAEVLTLCNDTVDETTYHHPIIDGWTTQPCFADAVDTARSCIQNASMESPVVIHCAAGESRSSAVVATALAADEDMTFVEAVSHVHAMHPPANIRTPLLAHGREYLGIEPLDEFLRQSDYPHDPELVLDPDHSSPDPFHEEESRVDRVPSDALTDQWERAEDRRR